MRKLSVILLGLLFIHSVVAEPVTNKIFKKYSKLSDVPSNTIQTLLARRVLFPLSKDYLNNWRKNCLKKSSIDCRYYGLSILNNGNVNLAKDMFLNLCRDGDNESCLLRYQLALTEKRKVSLKILAKKNCDKKSSECFGYERILFAEGKTKEALALSEENCLKRDHSKSCKNLFGGFLEKIDMKKLNPAVELKKRCELKDVTSCFQQTLIDKAMKFVDSILALVESCKAGILEGCRGVVEAVKSQEKLLENKTIAENIYFICTLGNEDACKLSSKLDSKNFKKELAQLNYFECNLNPKKSCYQQINDYKPKKMVDFKTIKVPEKIREFINIEFKKCSYVTVDKIKFQDGLVEEAYKIDCVRKKSRSQAILYANGQTHSLRDYDRKGKLHGTSQFYNFAGEINRIESYKNGAKDGDFYEFFIPGILKSIKKYKNNSLTQIVLYYQNGVMKSYEEFDSKGKPTGGRYVFGQQGGVLEKALFKKGQLVTPLQRYKIEELKFEMIEVFEIVKVKNKYQCIRRGFDLNNYLLEQKRLDSSAHLDLIDKTYYEGVNALGRKVFYVEDKKKCSKAISMIKSTEN
ncbi:MAG: hypothetical protein GY909_01550 [Oligoflexia bacterium]|nr:hypothetical protein [Oligoflexia bacterium]